MRARASAQDGRCARKHGGPQCVCSNLQLLIVSPACEVVRQRFTESVVLWFIQEESKFTCRSFQQLMHTRLTLNPVSPPPYLYIKG